MLGGVLRLLFPNSCVGCRRAGCPWCRECLPAVGHLTPPGCDRCGRPFPERVTAACADCPPSPVSWCRAAYLYEGPVRRALFSLKFGGMRSVAEAMAPAMVEALARSPPVGFLERAPVVTWVPLGRKRKRSRGYDQAEALARAVAGRTGLRATGLLDRAEETGPQARRPGRDRRRALAGVFGVRAGSPSHVILVDDVLTSGATAADCVRALLEGGAEEVAVLTAARSLGGPVPDRCYNPPGSSLGLWLPGRPSPGSRCQSQAKRPT
jgi:ComF family protein